ncbi:MAG TPA: flagellar motor protein MotB [Lacipirellulaceae bacterium]|nr:flagellar motor protein MotB [Lacipirellulaceae bacterium]
MAGKGGGAWKVAYADFVTAMMAFFMVMWLTAQKPDVKQAVAGYFREPFAVFRGNESGSAAAPTPTDDPKRGHNAEAQKRRLPHAGDDMDYQFTIVFGDGQGDLDPAGREMVRNFAPALVGKLNRVEIRAHCLRKPLPEDSPYGDRWDLCYGRARAVRDALVALGVEAERLRLSLAEANEPLAVNLTDEELKLNSRVDVILLPDLMDTPWRRTASTAPGAPAEAGPAHAPDAGHGH